MTRDDLIAEARTWIGTPWKHQAALKGVGCDCIGFIAGSALALGSKEAGTLMATSEFRTYGRKPDGLMLARACRELLDQIPIYAALPGDILLMRFNAEPQHFAMVSERNMAQMIHAYAAARKVVEHGMDMIWRRRIVGAFRLRGIE